eukprot:scaffold61936_cov33-Phaeocystis_antarctica.AAC.1
MGTVPLRSPILTQVPFQHPSLRIPIASKTPKNVTFSSLEAALGCVPRRIIARPHPLGVRRGFWCHGDSVDLSFPVRQHSHAGCLVALGPVLRRRRTYDRCFERWDLWLFFVRAASRCV